MSFQDRISQKNFFYVRYPIFIYVYINNKLCCWAPLFLNTELSIIDYYLTSRETDTNWTPFIPWNINISICTGQRRRKRIVFSRVLTLSWLIFSPELSVVEQFYLKRREPSKNENMLHKILFMWRKKGKSRLIGRKAPM